MTIKIGPRTVIKTEILHVPENEDAWLEFDFEGWKVKINVIFTDDDKNPEQAINFFGKNDHGVIEVKNWKSTFPSAILTPLAIGQHNNKIVSLLCSGYQIGALSRLDLTFLWESKNVEPK